MASPSWRCQLWNVSWSQSESGRWWGGPSATWAVQTQSLRTCVDWPGVIATMAFSNPRLASAASKCALCGSVNGGVASSWISLGSSIRWPPQRDAVPKQCMLFARQACASPWLLVFRIDKPMPLWQQQEGGQLIGRLLRTGSAAGNTVTEIVDMSFFCCCCFSYTPRVTMVF